MMAIFGAKYFQMNDHAYFKQCDKFFFTDLEPSYGFQFTENFYDQNEALIFHFIHESVKSQDQEADRKIDVIFNGNGQIYKDCLENKPNITKLREFFRSEMIQELYFGEQGYYHSEHFANKINRFNLKERQNFIKYFRKIVPAHIDI